jgi:hypothetical protein
MAKAIKQMSNPSPRIIRFPVFIIVSLVDIIFGNFAVLHDHDKLIIRIMSGHPGIIYGTMDLLSIGPWSNAGFPTIVLIRHKEAHGRDSNGGGCCQDFNR